MEDAMLSFVVGAVSSIMGKLHNSYFGGDITSQEIRKLQTIILPKIQTVIEAAETIPADKLKPWLMDLKAAAFEAEDVLDLYEYEAIKNKIMQGKYAISCYKPLQKLKAKSKEFFAFMLPKTKLKYSLEKLEQSANEAEKLLPFISTIRQTAPQRDAKSQQSTPTVSGMSSPIFGREGESDNLIKMLISEVGGESTCSRTSIPVLAVIGIGGAGKTTMAQAIYNNPGVESHFDTRMWVHVSRNFDVHRVTREIIEQGGSRCSDISSLNAVQKMLEKILNSKKFLLVLDDIWCEDKGEWDKLLIPLNKVGDKGSRILITTRTEGVSSILGVENNNLVPLKELKDEDCWSILKYYAFGDASKKIEDRSLANVGKKIAYKLKNSPLAARLVGSLLRRKVDVDAWEMVLKQDMLSDTLNCLLLSFQFLPPHLQRCFASCSLFRKGKIFHTARLDDVVLLWIAEGFVEFPEDNELTTVERGRQYFNELVSYSFFQSCHDYANGYVIHDLLHDLAEKVSKGHCFRMEADDPIDIPPTTVHLSIVEWQPPMPFPDVSVLVNLRTLMCIRCSRIDGSLLDVCAKLRVLYYADSISELPRSIDQLRHLRYLKAALVEQLPDSFSRLYHLQFLHLPDHSIERMPKSFNNLVNLQGLLPADLTCKKIPEIGKLTLLQTLESYRVEMSREFGIGQLKNLNRLGGSLEIKGKIEATEARLNQKRHLEELSLKWDRSISRDGRVDEEEVLEGIEPHSNLKKLEISGYRGAKEPSWMRHILPGLQSLRLIDCPNITGVFSLPDSLNRLEVINCPELKQLSPFPHSLKELTINNSSRFEDLFSIFISFNEEEENRWRLHQQNSDVPQPFAIEHLKIIDCSVLRGETTFNLSLLKFDLLRELELEGLPKLTSLILGPNLKHLYYIRIKNCPEMVSLTNLPTSLEYLDLSVCPKLQSLEGIGALPHLESLKVSKCPKLATGERAGAHCLRSMEIDDYVLLAVLLDTQGLNSIDRLRIRGCPHDRPLNTEEEDLLLQLTSIKRLEFWECEKLRSLPVNLEKLTSLTGLHIMNCPEIESLPNLPTSLDYLCIERCPTLRDKYGRGGPLHHKISRIRHITI